MYEVPRADGCTDSGIASTWRQAYDRVDVLVRAELARLGIKVDPS